MLCPTCGREFSEYLVVFPAFIDDKDQTMVYNKCPICSLEARGESFTREHSKKLYEEAIKEVEETGQTKKKKPVAKKNIKWEKLVRLTNEEMRKVIKVHPELAAGAKIASESE